MSPFAEIISRRFNELYASKLAMREKGIDWAFNDPGNVQLRDEVSAVAIQHLLDDTLITEEDGLDPGHIIAGIFILTSLRFTYPDCKKVQERVLHHKRHLCICLIKKMFEEEGQRGVVKWVTGGRFAQSYMIRYSAWCTHIPASKIEDQDLRKMLGILIETTQRRIQEQRKNSGE